MTESIVSAAIYHGVIVSLPAPARHGTILTSISRVMLMDAMHVPPFCQGFLTSTGRYVNRVEAYEIAWRANQIISETKGPKLFSEDLW